ncbi:MAG: DNA polymerase III subunit alpha, partial [Candidatus Zophobacter franzmannii]|nr:DNA polymerase III subunit alpha [Candidatus Zophobacter franzmannii]
LKMDFLGLKTLTVINKTVQMLKQDREIEVDINNVELDDEDTYKLLSDGLTGGVFQYESKGMQRCLRDLKPNCFEDLIAMVALYRPGPMNNIPSFIKRKHGEEKIEYDHPIMENTLKETYGVTVYQEQVMQLSKEMAGFTSAQAGTLGKAISKKKAKMMEEMYVLFRDGCLKNDIEHKVVDKVWKDWKDFADYAFNKSHAACYAFVAYQTAYLKAHFPVEFLAANLTLSESPDDVTKFLEECQKMDIEVVPPNINLSKREFSVKDDEILFGFKGIKNVGVTAVKAIVADREKDGPYKGIFDLMGRCDSQAVNKTVLESLISAGGFDEFDGNRASHYDSVEAAVEYSTQVMRDKRGGQMTLFSMFEDEDEGVTFHPELAQLEEWNFMKRLEMERNVLGFYLSGHPLMQYKYIIEHFANADSGCLALGVVPASLRVVGIVSSKVRKKSKRGKIYGFITLEDMQGKFELSLFGEDFDKYFEDLIIGEIYYIKGSNSSYESDSSLKIKPKLVLPIEDVMHSAKGEIWVQLDEKNAGQNFADLLSELSDEDGGFSFVVEVDTEEFGTLRLTPKNLKTTLTKKIIDTLSERVSKLSLKFES